MILHILPQNTIIEFTVDGHIMYYLHKCIIMHSMIDKFMNNIQLAGPVDSNLFNIKQEKNKNNDFMNYGITVTIQNFWSEQKKYRCVSI